MFHSIMMTVMASSALMSQEAKITPRFDADKAILAIEETRNTKDFAALVAICEEARKSLPESSVLKLNVMKKACIVLGSVTFNHKDQSRMRQDLAVSILKEFKNDP